MTEKSLAISAAHRQLEGETLLGFCKAGDDTEVLFSG